MPAARAALIQRRQPAHQYTETTNTAGRLSEIYRITVPRGEVWMLDPTRPFVFIPLAKAAWTPAAVGAQTVDVTAYGGLMQLVDAAGNNLTYGLPNYEAIYQDADDAARTITAHDTVANTITISDATATAHTVFYPPDQDGYLEIRIEDPRGLGKVSYAIAAMNSRVYLTWNFWSSKTAMGLQCPFPIPEDFDIVFYLEANWTIGWETPFAGAIAVKNNLFLPIKTLPRATFDRGLEDRVRDLMVKLAR